MRTPSGVAQTKKARRFRRAFFASLELNASRYGWNATLVGADRFVKVPSPNWPN